MAGLKVDCLMNVLSRDEVKQIQRKYKIKSKAKTKKDLILSIKGELSEAAIEEIKKKVKLKLSSKRNSYYVFTLLAKNSEIFALKGNLELFGKKNDEKFSNIEEKNGVVSGFFSYKEVDTHIGVNDELVQFERPIHVAFEVDLNSKKIFVWSSNFNRVINVKRALKAAGVRFTSMDLFRKMEAEDVQKISKILEVEANKYLKEVEIDG